MKTVFGLLFALSLFVCVPGCGGDDGPTNVGENANQSEIDAYLAEQAKSEQEAEAGAAEIEAATP